jgi:hypothetical protein
MDDNDEYDVNRDSERDCEDDDPFDPGDTGGHLPDHWEEWVAVADGNWLILHTVPSGKAAVLQAIRSSSGAVQVYGLFPETPPGADA